MFTKDEIIDVYTKLGVSKGDILCVQSSYKGLDRGMKEGPEAFVDALIELLGKEGTLIMPAYNFTSWTEKHYFDISETPSTVGATTEVFRKKDGVKRTLHPIHSLSVWGKEKDNLCSIDALNSFGKDSVFSYLLEKNAKYSTAGLGLEMPFLPCHLAETEMDVPYRRVKHFSGIYVDSQTIPSLKTYCFNARREEFRKMQPPIYKTHIMQYELGAFANYNLNGVNFWIGQAKDYHSSLIKLISDNPKMFGWE